MHHRIALVLLALAAPLAAVLPSSSTVSAAPKPPTLRVAVANAHEGAAGRTVADLRDGRDRAALVRRVHARKGPRPDVLLLQEVRGSARDFARAFSRHPRAKRADAAYAVVTTPRLTKATGSCAGSRSGSYAQVRTSSILRNTSTTSVIESGTIETWGRWGALARRQLGSAAGCTEHPWALLAYGADGARQTALVVSAHVAPQGAQVKNRAMRSLRGSIDRLARDLGADLVVMGGDLNQTRCQGNPRSVERAGCAVRPGHRAFLDHGYRDVMRSHQRSGQGGVTGAKRRIDFLYTTGQVDAAWWDRCYMGWLARTPRCSAKASVFPTPTSFHPCKRRSLKVGQPGGGCPPARYRDYYGDHPVLVASLRS